MGRTDFLFARPSFLNGAARVFDIGGTLNVYNESPSTKIADLRALRSDWEVVGRDMRAAFNMFEKNHNDKIKQSQA